MMDVGFVLITFAVFQCSWCMDVHYFVSPSGSDTNNGSSSNLPLKTIAKAITLASASSNSGKNLFIELLPGFHDLTSTLHVQHKGHNLTIRSYKNQDVHVTGGLRIPANSLKTVTDHKVLDALPAGSRRFIKYVHLPDLHITKYGSLHEYGSGSQRQSMLEVFFNGKPLRLARWPNEGFIDITGVPDGRYGHRIKYNSTKPKSWKFLDDVWVYGFWYYAWSERAFHVKSLDANNMLITFDNKTGVRQGFRTGHLNSDRNGEGGYFRFINIMSELDEPGEYYLDKNTGNLYVFMPTHDGNVRSSDVIYVSIVDTCIAISSHVQNVILSGFILEACRQKGIYARDVNSIHIQNMEIRNTGDYGVYFSAPSAGCTISKSVFHGTDGAVYISGGNRTTLESSGNTVEDCKFYQFSREGAFGKPAVMLYGVGNLVRYNEMAYSQAVAIQFHGNDHIMEYNHIHHMCLNVSNCAAILSSQDLTFRGNKIRYNIIHDTQEFYPGNDVKAIMLDNMFSSAEITNNVFYNNQIHVQIGGGRDNVVNNNVMYNAAKYSIQVDGRGLHINSNLNKTLQDKLHRVPYRGSLWSARYPELAGILSQNETFPRGNQIHKNIIYKLGKKEDIHGLSNSIKDPIYFNVTDTGYSYGIGDHFDVKTGDLRLRCHAAAWANRVNFQQVVSPNDVGPRYDVGPPFNRIVRHTIHLTGSANVCPTVAPAKASPMPAYLPDGSGQTPLLKVYDEGCWLNVTKCTNDPDAIGTYRDMYGERLHSADENEAACLHGAVTQWHFCGSKPDEPVTAIYGPTGATTFGGDGCLIATYSCPKHGGPTDGHVVPGKFYEETHANAGLDQEHCLARALAIWHGCGSFANHPVTAIYRPTGAVRTAGAGCWIKVEKCPKHQSYKPLFYDAEGATNAQTDILKDVCLTRAAYYWLKCGSDRRYPVTAFYRPTTDSKTYP